MSDPQERINAALNGALTALVVAYCALLLLGNRDETALAVGGIAGFFASDAQERRRSAQPQKPAQSYSHREQLPIPL